MNGRGRSRYLLISAVVIILLFQFTLQNEAPIAVQKPVNVSIGEPAVFECSFNGPATVHIQWLVNGINIDMYGSNCPNPGNDIIEGSQGNITSTLELLFPSQDEVGLWNNSKVSCQALVRLDVNGSQTNYSCISDPVLLLIQGKLGPPQNLSIKFNGSTEEIIVVWEQPLYVLLGITITLYEINGTLTCIDRGGDEENILGTINEIVPGSIHAFRPNITNEQNCRDYNLTVCVNAVTAAGPGKEECKNQTIPSNVAPPTNMPITTSQSTSTGPTKSPETTNGNAGCSQLIPSSIMIFTACLIFFLCISSHNVF